VLAELFELGKPMNQRASNPILFHGTVPYGGRDGAAISINHRSFGVIGSCFIYSDSQSAHAELLLKKIFSIIGVPPPQPQQQYRWTTPPPSPSH
jgi:hypothetical protein